MVRVFSAHHFVSQSVTSLEKVTDMICVCPGQANELFFGRKHYLGFYSLINNELKSIFPTIDTVVQMVYCKKGNFLICLEYKKCQNENVTFARVYLNWNKLSGCDKNISFKARIAGVSPSSQSESEALEIIELPSKRSICYVNCCEKTGNIILSCGTTLFLYKFCKNFHPISKKEYIDFQEFLEIKIDFFANEVVLLEDLVGYFSPYEFHVIQIISENKELNSAKNTKISESLSDKQNKSQNSDYRCEDDDQNNSMDSGNSCINENSASNSSVKKSSNYVDFSKIIFENTYLKNQVAEENCLLYPSLCGSQNAALNHFGEYFGPVHGSEILSPVSFKNFILNEYDYKAVSLLYRKIVENTDIEMPFSNLIIKPINAKFPLHESELNDKSKRETIDYSNLRESVPGISEIYGFSSTIGVSIFISTPYTGFYYHLSLSSNYLENSIQVGGTYTYTSPVSVVALEPYLLHALTLTGLETYTLRPHPLILKDSMLWAYSFSVPNRWEDSVCLVGLRPFLNVRSMTLTQSCLSLIAFSEESSEANTLYTLRLPTITEFYKEIMRIVENYRIDSPPTYLHLLLEAFFVIINAIYYRNMRIWKEDESCQFKEKSAESKNTSCESEEELCKSKDESFESELEGYFQDVSALIADFYAGCNTELDWKQAFYFYQNSELQLDAILERLLSLRGDKSAEMTLTSRKKANENTSDSTEITAENSLVDGKTERKSSLAFIIMKFLLRATTAEKFCLLKAQCKSILDVLIGEAPDQLSTLVIECPYFKQFDCNKILEVIENEVDAVDTPRISDILALLILMVETKKLEQLSNVISRVKTHELVNILVKKWRFLLVESENEILIFTDLSKILCEQKPDLFTDTLIVIMSEQRIHVDEIVTTYMNAFPIVTCTYDCNVNSLRLRDFIEYYFLQCRFRIQEGNEFSSHTKSVQILMHFYSASLVGAFKIKDEKDLKTAERRSSCYDLFSSRSEILDQFSPFNGEKPASVNACVTEVKRATSECTPEIFSSNDNDCLCSLCCVDLLVMQSLLCSNLPTIDDRKTVLKLVSNNPKIKGAESLKFLCLNFEDQLDYLADNFPASLLSFCKHVCKKSKSKWRRCITKLMDKIDHFDEEKIDAVDDKKIDAAEDKKIDAVEEEAAKNSLEKIVYEIANELIVNTTFSEFSEVLQNHESKFKTQIKQAHFFDLSNVLKESIENYAGNILKHDF